MKRTFFAGAFLLAGAIMGTIGHPTSALAIPAPVGPGTSCTVPASGDQFATFVEGATAFECATTSAAGPLLASKLIIHGSSSTSLNIGVINAIGDAWVGSPTSISVSGGIASCAPTGHNTSCTNLQPGSVVTFSDSSLPNLGTLTFTWQATGSGVAALALSPRRNPLMVRLPPLSKPAVPSASLCRIVQVPFLVASLL